VRTRYRLGLDGFDPCAILLNNDLSAGIPEILQNLNEQFILPPVHAGWAVRRKSNHFAAYDRSGHDFAKAIGIDPWRINPAFSVCRSINFHERQGEECLAAKVAAVLDIRKSTRNTASTRRPTWWSRPMPAPTAWAS
jgi:glutamate--cysteine ligase